MMKAGVISDTHGLLRPEVITLFEGCSLIFHAGDIGNKKIIDTLSRIAPVKAVRGNNDKDDWSQSLPEELFAEIEGKVIYMIHDLKESKVLFRENKIDLVISGHSHSYKEEQKGNVFYLNPGAAGPKRFGKPISVVLLEINKDGFTAQYIEI